MATENGQTSANKGLYISSERVNQFSSSIYCFHPNIPLIFWTDSKVAWWEIVLWGGVVKTNEVLNKCCVTYVELSNNSCSHALSCRRPTPILCILQCHRTYKHWFYSPHSAYINEKYTFYYLRLVSPWFFCVGICTTPLQYDFVNHSLGYDGILIHHITYLAVED